MEIQKTLIKYLFKFYIITNLIFFLSCNKNNELLTIDVTLSSVVKINNDAVEDIIVEVFSSPVDRDMRNNMITSKKTDKNGYVSFSKSDLNKNNSLPDKINGVFYLNLFKGNNRGQAETEFIDFNKNKNINQSITLEDANAEKIIVKVAVVYENPYIKDNNQRFHESFKTPGYTFKWNDPVLLSKAYEKALEEVSHNTVDYQIIQEIDAERMFTYLKNDPSKKLLTIDEIVNYLKEENWKTFKDVETSYDYNAMVSYYEFDKMRDRDEIQEVWVWTFPYGGMYESHMMGDSAFWINSPANENPTCSNKLSIMGLNYERDLACALESYGHRFESTMMQVFGWWDYDNKANLSDLTSWELFSAYKTKYDKYEKGLSQVGNVHFPPNGTHDYDFGNETNVESYVDDWLNYPFLRSEYPKTVNRSEWGNPEGSWQLGWMKYYLGRMPHFKGVNPVDGKLNNWWNYVINYDDAIQKTNL